MATQAAKHIDGCEVCGNQSLVEALSLGMHPMCDDLVPFGDSRVCSEYPIEIMFCDICRTAHQKYQVPKRELFPVSYHYRSRFTADVLNGMESLVASCEARFGDLSGKKVLDIGCNDGSLLDFFRKRGASTFGIEPTGACQDAAEKGHHVINDYLSEAVAAKIVEQYSKPDIITFTNVFAHIENLGEVLRSLKQLMAPSTVIVIENHYLGAVLDANQFDTFYHEHPRTYSYTSFKYMAQSLGLDLLGVEFPSRYGGNIRIFMGGLDHWPSDISDLSSLEAREAKFGGRLATLRKNIENWRAHKSESIAQLVKQYGKLRAKAFPGRAAILIKLLGIDENIISAVFEKPGSLKIGNYLPGTRIPIFSDDELFQCLDDPAPVINLAWHIPVEIHTYLADNNFRSPIIDILSQDDFA